MSRTIVSSSNLSKLLQARALVADAIPRLEWRHSGLGMLQGYVLEGEGEELRVHIWHHSLKHPGIDGRGLGHDHRFDMTSWVLLGRLRHIEVEALSDKEGSYQIYDVVNARKAFRETGISAGEFRIRPDRLNLRKRVKYVSAGEIYSFPKRLFHETYLDSPLVITLVLKMNQEDTQARILSRVGQDPLNAFGSSLKEQQFASLLVEARAALLIENRLNATYLAKPQQHSDRYHASTHFGMNVDDVSERVLGELRSRSIRSFDRTDPPPPVKKGFTQHHASENITAL